MTLQETLIAQLQERAPYVSHRDDPHAFASEAMSCSRKMALRIWHRADPQPPRDSKLSGLLALRIGEKVHEMIQTALLKTFEHCQIELSWDLPATSGRVDGVYEGTPGLQSTRTVVEIKSMSTTMFKRSVKSGKPEIGHLMQAMLGAKALNAPFVHIIYVNKAARPNEEAFLEWILDVDVEATDLEIERQETIVRDAELGIIPEPFYQGELITDPEKHYWPCGFCLWSDECKLLGPGRVTLTANPNAETLTVTELPPDPELAAKTAEEVKRLRAVTEKAMPPSIVQADFTEILDYLKEEPKECPPESKPSKTRKPRSKPSKTNITGSTKPS